jgi:hypothetical protein
VAGKGDGTGIISNRRFGHWLMRVRGQIINGYKLVKVRISAGYPLWSLQKA